MKQTELMRSRRFLPLFITEFLGSFNDNLLGSALIVLITYHFSAAGSVFSAGVMVALCTTLLVIPFPILSPIAGQLADKYDKSKLIRLIKISEVIIMFMAAYGFINSYIYLLMFMVLMTGVHSAFFGPLKYSILSDHLSEDELLPANSLIAGGTYASVLAGLVMGGLVFEFDKSGHLIAFILTGGAIIGLISGWLIPSTKPSCPDLQVNHNFIMEAVKIIKYAKNNRSVILSILGLSWFLLISAIFMGQLPTYAKAVGGDNEVYTLFLMIFSLGIAAGSLLCNKLLKGKVSARFTPLVSLLISIFIFALVFTSTKNTDGNLAGIYEFTTNISNWPLMFSMLGIAIAGGIYIVPLYTIMQSKSEPAWRSRVIAARNVINSIFITIAMIISAALLALGLDLFDLFLIIASINILIAIYSCILIPELPNKVLASIQTIKGGEPWKL